MDAPDPWPPPEQRRLALVAAALVVAVLLAGLVWFLVVYPRGESPPERVPVSEREP
jgi:hypothetical protein